ncbi:MAG: hypothetical protein ACRC0C_14820 [Gibbsiella quercinecans]
MAATQTDLFEYDAYIGQRLEQMDKLPAQELEHQWPDAGGAR